MTQNYYLIDNNTNVCVQIVVWDGNENIWQPPENTIALPSDTTKVKDWFRGGTKEQPVTELQVVDYEGAVGFTWDGEYLITNKTLEQYMEQFRVPTDEVTQV